MAASVRIESKRKIAFVCSGGAAKAGAFHLGVALALREHGFRFYGGLQPKDRSLSPPGPMDISVYVGSSAGSMICAYLAAGYSVDDIMNAFMDRKVDEPGARPLQRLSYSRMFTLHPSLTHQGLKRGMPLVVFKNFVEGLMSGDWEGLFQFRWLKIPGIFSTTGIEAYLREEVLPSDHFRDYAAELFITATQLNHSRKIVFGKYGYRPPPHDLTCQYNNDIRISQAVAASTALPPIYAPFEMALENDSKMVAFVDGEIRDTLSTHVAVDAGCDLLFASYTHQPYHFQKQIGSLSEYGLPAVLVQSIYLLVEQKINNHIHNKDIQRRAIQAVHSYCKSEGMPAEQAQRILEIMETELHHRLDVDSIYIHPSPRDTQMFFGDHFSLSPKKMSEVVRSGFRAAIDRLRRYEFADRKVKSAVGNAAPTQVPPAAG